jgi:GTP diphosphokinase / guanosine-3',5'-bis(diphosphate) 3'-diphosphatase
VLTYKDYALKNNLNFIMKFLNLKKKIKESVTDIKFGIDKDADLRHLLSDCSENLTRFDEKLISKAYHWCYEANKNRLLLSGEPFYTYYLSVAHIVISEIPLDDTSVASALLVGCIHHDSPYNLGDIRSEFSGTITEIVENIVTTKKIDPNSFSQLENYRKLLLSLFKDVRIILIVLADKVHNLRTLEFLDEERRIQQAKESMEVYAPFAQRFGLFHIKWEIEDLSFKYLNNKAYNEIKDALKLTRKEREDYLKKFTKKLKDRLEKVELFKKNNVGIEITARAKHIYSIFNKMIAREKGIDELYDLFAVRIIIDSEENSYCFLAYGILTELYKPVPGTFKNYISSPKKNGYQSIHTAVFGQGDKPVEVQIRTRKMHEVSERGLAAHFDYKRGLLPAQSVLDDKELLDWMNLVRNTFESASELENPADILESLKSNLFQDEIYIFTPSKEFRVLPKDSTPLDFAYNIHSEVGNHCIGAKVNSRVVPLNYKLKSGDQIEILTSKKQKPSREWLDFVISHRAKAHIQKYFREEKKISVEKGKESWHKMLNYMKLRLSDTEIDLILSDLKFEDIESFYALIGNESIDITLLYGYLKDKYNQNDPEAQKFSGTVSGNINSDEILGKADFQKQSSNIKYLLAECCNPIPGDQIFGILNDAGDVVIHHRECKKIDEFRRDNKFQVFEIEWPAKTNRDFNVKLKIIAGTEPEILNSISQVVFNTPDISMKNFSIDNKESIIEGFITLKIKDLSNVADIIAKVSKINGVFSFERVFE